MFRVIDRRTATNDHGITVQRAGRDFIRYRDGDKVMLIPWERAATPDQGPAQIVYVDDKLKWQPPNEAIDITPEQIAEIADNVTNAYRELGLTTYIYQR